MKKLALIGMVWLLLFAGCAAPVSGAAEEDGKVYAAQKLALPGGMESVVSLFFRGERVFLLGQGADETGRTRALAGSMLPDGSDYRALALPETDGRFVEMCGAPDGVVLIESTGDLRTDGEIRYALVFLPDTGGTRRADVTARTGSFCSRGLACDGEGRVYVACADGIAAFGADGAYLFTLDAAGAALCGNGTGAVYALYQGHGVCEFREIDGAKGKIGASFGADGIVFSGTRRLVCADVPTVVLGDALYEYRDGALREVFRFTAVDRDPGMLECAAGGGGERWLCTGWGPGGPELYAVARLPAGAEKSTLTLAAFGSGASMREYAVAFSRTSGTTRVEIVDYWETESMEDGLARFTAEAAAGTAPDLIDLRSLPYTAYAASGFLRDLYPLMDAGTGLSREDFVPSFLQAAEIGGAVYALPLHMAVPVLTGAESVTGGRIAASPEELEAMLAAHPETEQVFCGMTREDTLVWLTALHIGRFVDYETGRTAFDSEDFLRILRIAAHGPEKIDWSELRKKELITSGRALYGVEFIGGVQDYQLLRAQYGEALTLCGVPSASGEVAGCASGLVGIAQSCAHPEGAWEFLSFLVREAGKSRVEGFPMLRDELEAAFAEAAEVCYETNEHGARVRMPHMTMYETGGGVYEIFEASGEELDGVRALTGAVGTLAFEDPALSAILREEAGAYFAGAKTAEETAALIQSRAGIYFAENAR